MLSALLAVIVIWSSLAGRLPEPWPLLPGAALAVLLFFFGLHKHDGVLTTDRLARRSQFSGMNPDLKVWGSVALLVLCVCAKSPWPPVCLFFIMAVLTIGGGVPLCGYLSLITVPTLFFMLSGLSLLWSYAPIETGIASVRFLQGYFVLTLASQKTAGFVMARALGGIGCLYFLSLSTSMPEILAVLRRAHMPAVVSDLSVLIYRYVFILLSTSRNMKNAAASRLGYGSPRQSLRTTGLLYGNLLAHSFRRAGACFDAMESRCYTGTLLFLERGKAVRVTHVVLFAALLVGMAAAVFLPWGDYYV